MLRSMTGYGGSEAVIEGVDYRIEIRSVNGRYFKASIKLPEMWSHFEATVTKRLRERLNRGTVTFTLRMRRSREAAAFTVNVEALSQYVAQARSALPEGARFDAGSLLLLPGVCEPPVADDLCQRSTPALLEAIDEALEHLIEMRRREGEALLNDLTGHCDRIEEDLGSIASRKDSVVADYRDRLLVRVNELVNAAEMTVGEQDLLREVAVFAERSDISEEIARLHSHLDQFRRLARQDASDGRKLEFIGQEMFREANTIASKSNDAEITRAVVEVKAAVDRIKEQVANVE